MKHAEFVVSLQYKKEHLSEAILIAKEHRYADYFKFTTIPQGYDRVSQFVV